MNSTNVLLTWDQVVNTTNYMVQVSKNSNTFIGNGVVSSNVSNSSNLQLSGLSDGQYFWRVKAMPTTTFAFPNMPPSPVPTPTLNQSQQTQQAQPPIQQILSRINYVESNWSLVRSFTITSSQQIVDPQQTPEVKSMKVAPQLLSPLNGAFAVPVISNLTWRAMNNIQATYDVQIATDSKFNTIIEDVTGLTVPLYAIQNLQENTHYYWRVKAIVSATNTSNIITGEWSQVWAFNTAKTGVKLTVPEIIAPDANAISGVIPELSWTTVEGARYYHVQAAKDTSFRYLVFGSELVSTTSVKLPAQPQGVTIYWRVRAVGNGAITNWTAISSFVTETLQTADSLEMKVRSKISDAGDISSSITVVGNRTSSYYISVKNTASRAVVVSLIATGGQAGWTVNYFDDTGKVITKQIVNNSTVSTYLIKLPAFGSYYLRADITPSSGSNAASQLTNTITAAYADNAAINASVTINTYRK